MLNNTKILLVLSGKGGVGKSTVSVQLALAYQKMGHKVGLLDIDLCGPSIPHMLGLESKDVHQCDEGWIPVYTDESQSLAVMSIGFLLSRSDESVVWRGPKKTAMIKQFMTDVAWRKDLDLLIIDTPPGTSDEHIAIMEAIKAQYVSSAVLVTTPQAVSVNDVLREYSFCKKVGINVAGVIENMCGFECPNCSECTYVFSKSGGKLLAEKTGTKFLAAIPIDPNLAVAADEGINFAENFGNSRTANLFREIVEAIQI